MAYLIELDHIRMSNFLQNVNLSCHSLYITLVFDSVLFQNFDSNFFACDRVRTNSYFSEGSGSKRSA